MTAGWTRHRNVLRELLLKDRVEVLAAADGGEAVGVGQLREDANVAGALVSGALRHVQLAVRVLALSRRKKNSFGL